MIDKFNEFNEYDDDDDYVIKHPMSGCCYVAHQGIANLADMFEGRPSIEFYPESGYTLLELCKGVSFNEPIVTESPWIVSCYNDSKVFVWENGKWENPRFQTYGCSINILMSRIFKISSTIPIRVESSVKASATEEAIRAIYK